MTQEQKEILLKDLCARLPYEVMVECSIECGESIDLILSTSHIDELVNNSLIVKPYLRPMSSMTDEERNELNNYIFSEKGLRYFWFDYGIMYSGPDNQCFIGLGNDTIDRMMDWLNAHHFDYRGLIEKGLAIEAPEDMYK